MKQFGPIAGKAVALAALAAAVVVPGSVLAQGSTGPVERHNMRAVGYNDLQGRSAYQPTIQNQGGRWILYQGHHGGTALNPLTGMMEPNGVSIVDVTNPANPKYLYHLAGAGGEGEAGGRQMTRVCSGDVLPSGESGKWYLLTTRGGEAHEIYDVTDPENPELVTVVVEGLMDTHKNLWDCESGIGYLVSGVPGWNQDRHLQIFDLSDPANPVFIRNYGIAGDEPGGTPRPDDNPNPGLHGPLLSPDKTRLFLGYGTGQHGIAQILDVELLLNGDPAPTPENFSESIIAHIELGPHQGAHTTLPLGLITVPEFEDFLRGSTRNMFAVINEGTGNGQCREAYQMVYLWDYTQETEPNAVSNYHVNERDGQFCERGGRFGAHASHENMNSPYGNKVLFVSWFNAGVRAIDIRNPWSPRELGYYIPRINPRTDERCVTTNGVQECTVTIQTNNVEVDDRGYIYVADRANSGMHILELTDEAKQELTRRPEAGTPPYEE